MIQITVELTEKEYADLQRIAEYAQVSPAQILKVFSQSKIQTILAQRL